MLILDEIEDLKSEKNETIVIGHTRLFGDTDSDSITDFESDFDPESVDAHLSLISKFKCLRGPYLSQYYKAANPSRRTSTSFQKSVVATATRHHDAVDKPRPFILADVGPTCQGCWIGTVVNNKCTWDGCEFYGGV